ncbi:MLP-like protein 43 [Punica granatum]|uniref:MLP-like protein 43 n=1 Tax=Punica granatum TaxID=22663 RepID=A0A218XLP5_PUNGR|nr:MLP-like protein 43 [Punica granatum]OWM86175.1 hypothetical protein CDL15_Pgr010999 [Punica granatum]
MAHVVHGRMEIDVGIISPAEKFHKLFSCRPQHIPKMSSPKLEDCKLHEGNWGKVGSVISWHYVEDGERKVAKEKIEAIDDEKRSTTFRVVDGDLTKLYKKFILIFQATPKEGIGGVARWTLEYEKLSEEVPEPYATLEFCAQVTKDIDSHLKSAFGAEGPLLGI